MNKEKIIEKIRLIREEIRSTPYHKGTEHHIGKLRAKLAKLEKRLQDKKTKKTGSGEGYAISKQGDATAVLVGPPSVGKSTLLNKLTGTKSKTGNYDFTTLNVVPGMLKINGANIQLLDVPGLIVGAAKGKGDGKQVLSVIRNSDLVILMSDVFRPDWLKKARKELYSAGVRLDDKKPKISVNKRAKGGINVIYPFSNISEKTIVDVAKEFNLKNAEIIIKEKLNTIDRLVDSFAGDRVFIPSISVINKVDLKKIKYSQAIFISAQKNLGLNKLKQKIWAKLRFIRVYLKPQKDKKPDYKNPLILKKGDSVKKAVKAVSSDLLDEIDYVVMWGENIKHPSGQIVSLSQPLFDKAVLYFKK